jgi:hypothetical protein
MMVDQDLMTGSNVVSIDDAVCLSVYMALEIHAAGLCNILRNARYTKLP